MTSNIATPSPGRHGMALDGQSPTTRRMLAASSSGMSGATLHSLDFALTMRGDLFAW